MSSNNWLELWNRRNVSLREKSTLQTLISLDGFDSGAGKIDEWDWTKYVQYIQNKMGTTGSESIFEVGCGSGAFLYPLFLKGHKVGGIDYSKPLISKARSVFDTKDFHLGEALDLTIEPQYDIVISNGVFHYFSGFDYARKVVVKMLQKAVRIVAITEVPDAALEKESEDARRGMLPPEDYDKKYNGLGHLYFERKWFSELAESNNCTCTITDQNISEYGNNQFRFNCILEKKI